jgi:hypothetical protein
MLTMNDNKRNMKPGSHDQDHINDMSDDAKRMTNNVTSQGDLRKPETRKEDLPKADRERFKDGVYTGTGTGAGPGGSTDTGGADTTSMEGQARTGTTDPLPNENTRDTKGRSSK